jgi:hypothetical protein
VRAIRDRTNKQIEGVLNAQQVNTYRQMFEQQRPGGDSGKQNGASDETP